MANFSGIEIILISLIFIWTGFVRTGLGFGGAALGLPLMLLIGGTPIFWLPIIGIHLLFFSSLSLADKFKQVDWAYLKQSLIYIIPTAIIGVFGLLSLPDTIMIIFIYSITIFYGIIWVTNSKINTNKIWIDKLLLLLGGYIAGTSLTGAPFIVAVFMRHITKDKLRNTLFVLWFILVFMKMTTFIAAGVIINYKIAIYLLPIAYIGHFLGIKIHNKIIQNETIFKIWLGYGLILISSLGLLKIFFI